ncbi:MAG: 30S ribosomal protein S6 [Gemmatimonadetes bacterium]|nr:30S ribosomal protein S6 [Gemmatimonadota bacterium]
MKETNTLSTNKYEMVVIIDAALEDEAIDREVEWIKSYLSEQGGELETLDLWGRRRLAYAIKKKSEGYYAVFRFTIGRDTLRGLERELGLRETVLRYMAVKRSPAADEAYAEAAIEAELKAEQARLRQEEAAAREEAEGGGGEQAADPGADGDADAADETPAAESAAEGDEPEAAEPESTDPSTEQNEDEGEAEKAATSTTAETAD